jgi:hypothetical protein
MVQSAEFNIPVEKRQKSPAFSAAQLQVLTGDCYRRRL